jgi:class 3 adenylate cyclase
VTAAELLCGSCGNELPPNSKFCNECGAQVSPAPKPAEYKQVTVLFADVVHSMDIAAAVGAERLREIMAELADSCAAVVGRYGGTVNQFTGDGIMAVFGAPAALEDHAVRACLAALGVQAEVKRLAADVRKRDGVELQLRVGLNSGEVIAGEMGPGPFGYTTVGEQVGMAQRMESVAPPGGVMLSESTAHLVEHVALLADTELVTIKGKEQPVAARRLLAIEPRHVMVGGAESSLVARRWEMTAVEAMVDQAIGGRGGVVGLVGSPGIGKSRVAREAAALAAGRGVEVLWIFCESHASDIPFYVVRRLLGAATGIGGLDGPAARVQLRAQFPDADEQDLLLLDDMLGIAEPDVTLAKIDADARRRRLSALIKTASLASTDPVLYIVEDAHWIDRVSESMLADIFTVIPQTPSMVLITYRPEYEGALTRMRGAQTITLAPLRDSETAALLGELVGSDSSVGELAAAIAERAAGNPFFAEEMVRDLTERGVLSGPRGACVCHTDVAEVSVPATLQSTIGARIDRLDRSAKRTLSAAAVIGSRFSDGLLTSLGVEPVGDELVSAELIGQVRFTPSAEYAFRHPLIRTVAYESQLKSDRAELHRRVAAAIESRDPATAEANAALIAEHLEAAGDLRAAYGFHMRAAAWATTRDINAARLSWERARKIADALPAEDPHRAAMRIAPRTMLCGIAYRVVHMDVAGARFDELRLLCDTAGDKASLAIAMAGLVMDHVFRARMREASQLASEAMALIESIGDPTLTVGLSILPIYAATENAEYSDALRWSQRVIDLAGGDPSKGNFLLGSPLAVALTQRTIARYALGRPGWRDDMRHGLAMAGSADPMTQASVASYVYLPGIPAGVLHPDDSAVREIENALRIAERSGDDLTLSTARVTLGIALVHRQTAAERDRGHKLLTEVSEVFVHNRHNMGFLPIVNAYVARERARHGHRDEAIPLMRAAVDDLFREGQLLGWGVCATGVLVAALLDRGAESDTAEAEAAIERLAAAPAEEGLAIREIWLLRSRALLARAHGHDAPYRDYRDRYREMATSLGFEGHMEWAEEMP